MAPGPDATLYVSIPSPGGSLIALLDDRGLPRPGWPIEISAWTPCGLLSRADDGSVRLLCNATDVPRPGNDASDLRAFAFDAGGRSLPGSPVQLGPTSGLGDTGRVVGDELTLFADGRVTTAAADGSIRRSTYVPMVYCCGGGWAVGPDGVAYGVDPISGWDYGSAEVSRITALDLDGVRAGWPVRIDGIASGPAFGPGGQIVVTVGSFVRRTSRLLVFDRDGEAVAASSTELPIATGAFIEPGAYECFPFSPKPPIVARDGTIFVISEIDTAVFALDPSLEVRRGWPYRPATPLVRPGYPDPRYDIDCGSLGVPAVGPDSVLYMPLQARDPTVGGSLVAVGPDGRVRPGWPVELRRPGAEFWSVVVGSDGTVYALAIEPEPGDASSASVLAIAPDSTVLYTTTIIDP